VQSLAVDLAMSAKTLLEKVNKEAADLKGANATVTVKWRLTSPFDVAIARWEESNAG